MMYYYVVNSLQPLIILFVIALLALANLWRKRVESRRRLVMATVPVIALYLFCLPVVSFLMIGSLEWRYPPPHERPDNVEAIVVLSAGIHPWLGIRRDAAMNLSGLYRCIHAADLYHVGTRCPIVVTGGKVDPDRRGPHLGDAMRNFLVELAVNDEDILVEREARSTYENALKTAEILRSKNIESVVLVTEALHMERSVRCFRAQGIRVAPSGCRYRATKIEWSIFSFLPSTGAARGNHDALHEWLGLIWYWLTDKI